MLNTPRDTTQYVITGTKFLRLASRKLRLFGSDYGGNHQNKEKSLRAMYWADEGKKLNQADQSGAEALIVAYLCRHGNLRDLFLNNIKPHVFVALHLFREKWKVKTKHIGLDIKPNIDELCNTSISGLRSNPFWKDVDSIIRSSDNWEPNERYYFIAKQVCHSSNYGVGAGMFVLNTLEKSKGKIVIDIKDAKKFLDFYHGLFPEIREWHREVEDQVRETRILYNLLGNPIQFTGDVRDEHAFKEMYSAAPQSTVACITNIAYAALQNYIEVTNSKWDMLNNCHDSLMTQSPIEESELCCKTMKQFVEMELTSPRGEKFRMKSEVQSGANWAPYHETKNPEGLR